MARNRNQFVVPQFIEVESKIIGPVSGRQFIILLVCGGLSYVVFAIFQSPYIFLPAIAILMGGGAVVAFGKVNGQAMHYFLLNMVQTLRRPSLQIWKRVADTPKKKKEKKVVMVEAPKKAAVSQSRLAEIALQVDTGGSYSEQSNM